MGDPPDGATPITDDERRALIPTFVATRGDLNLVEQMGIVSARRWALGTPTARSAAAVLTDDFIRTLHRRMFGDVWRWAGTYRTTERNIGVDPSRVAVSVRDLTQNAVLWVSPDARWTTPELACMRVHHQLVAIHPFPNGNGRHARLYTDVLGRSIGLAPFTWGGASLEGAGPNRAAHLAALRRADRNPDDLEDLLAFARS